MPRSRKSSSVESMVDWDAVKADSVEFSRQLLTDPAGNRVIPHPGQEAILRGIRRWTTVDTGRQFGKSTVMGVDASWFAATHANRTVMVIGPSLEQAKIIFNEISAYFRKAPLSYMVDGKIKEYPFPEIRLKNGTILMARGANSPQYIRGNRVHRAYVDEAAFVKDTVITDVIEPMFTVTGKEPDSALVLISTPFGRGAFYDYYQAGLSGTDPMYASFHFTSYDNPHADRTALERIKARYGEQSLLWRTEYLGIFDTDDRAVFPWADVKWATDNWGERDFPIAAAEGHRYVQGVDLANMRDYFVATIVDDTDPQRCYLARMDRYQKRGYPFYKQLVRSNYQAYTHARTLVDATSLGESVAQDLADIGAEGYKFAGEQAKFEVVQELARMLAEHRLLLPPQRIILDELRYFEYEVTASKRMKMEAAQGHDDIVMSLALSAHLAAIPRRLGLLRSVSVPRIITTPAHKPKRRPAKLELVEDPWAALFKEEDEDAR